MIAADYHTHHERCGHARGRIEEYVRAALALGMEEIGISDHAPIYWRDGDHALPGSAMARSSLAGYVEEVLALKRQYAGRIRVLLGLESDFAPGFEAVYREVLDRHPFDYVIGSVHWLGGRHIYDRGRWEEDVAPETVYEEYFAAVRASARSGLFQVLGHISGIMTYGPRPRREWLEREFARTAAELARCGVGIEINTSGLRKGAREVYPDPGLLRACVQAGVPVTYGSDAHTPEEVGYAREEAASLLAGAPLWRPGPAGGARGREPALSGRK